MSRWKPLLFLVAFTLSLPAGLAVPGWCSAPAAPAGRPPNELGLIPILMYHSVGGDAEFAGGPRYDKHGLNIAPETFRRQLQQMYSAGWFPVNMRDVLSARLPVPRGKTPVVLTFDDARPSQFRYLPDGRIDPDCAVGILEAFHRAHPSWPCRATFYVLPESEYNGVPFDQDGQETKKLRFLVRQGYELGNHTTSHRSMAHLSGPALRWEMGFTVRYFRREVPGTAMTTLALPYGIAPVNTALWPCLLAGSQGGTRYRRGTRYRNRCILLARGGPSFAFADKRFDPSRVPRVEAEPGKIERWIKQSQGASDPLYVSDGDPKTLTVPASALPFLNRRRLAGMAVTVLPAPPRMSLSSGF